MSEDADELRYTGIGAAWRPLLAQGHITQADVDLLVRLYAEVDRSIELEARELGGRAVVLVRCDDIVVTLSRLRAAYDPGAMLRAMLYDVHYQDRPGDEHLSPVGRIRAAWMELTPKG